MTSVLEEIRSWPWGWAWLTFFVVVLLRAGATYGLGRAAAAGLVRRRPPGARVERAMAQVSRWGPPAVTLSFLMPGVQSAVNFAAGLARMTVPRYLVGLVPGAMIWASIWTTIGSVVFLLAARGGSDRDQALLIAGIAVVVMAILLVMAKRSSAAVARREDRDTLDA